MPQRFQILFRAELQDVSPAALHSLAVYLLEPPRGEALLGCDVAHQAQSKPYSVRPIEATDQSNVHVLTLHHFADVDGAALRVRVHEQLSRTPMLGRTPLEVIDVGSETLPWVSFLAPVSGPSRWIVSLLTPTLLKRKRDAEPALMPTPGLLLSGLMRRWNDWAGDEFPLSADLASETISDTDLKPVLLEWLPASPGDETLAIRGQVMLALRSWSPDRQAVLNAMMRFADIAGVGKETTHGCGAVSTAEVPFVTRSSRLRAG
jgi:hypothetical protein